MQSFLFIIVEMTYDWEMTNVDEQTSHQLVTQKKQLKDEYKGPNTLPKINKTDMARTMESIEEYHRLHHGVMKAPLTYIIRI